MFAYLIDIWYIMLWTFGKKQFARDILTGQTFAFNECLFELPSHDNLDNKDHLIVLTFQLFERIATIWYDYDYDFPQIWAFWKIATIFVSRKTLEACIPVQHTEQEVLKLKMCFYFGKIQNIKYIDYTEHTAPSKKYYRSKWTEY